MPTQLLFIGDVTGEPALAYLEQNLPALVERYHIDFVVINAENLDITVPASGACGMTPASLARLFALPVDLVTGGNHSWDGADGQRVHDDPRVLRPLNYGRALAGRGAAVVAKGGVRLGVVNLVSRTALALADDPYDALEAQLAAWGDAVDLVLVDMHGSSVTEKLGVGFAFDGRVTAVLGTHTHVPTMDTRILPKGTAYCTDVGMTGPSGGLQGYQPERIYRSQQLRWPAPEPLMLATGPVELGAVLITCEGRTATHIDRLMA